MYFQKILFSKKFLACIFCFGLFTKIKRGLELVFSAYFLHTFSIKMYFIKYLLVDQVLMSILLSFSRYQIKWAFKFLFSQLVTSWNLKFEFDHLHKQWLTEEKRVEEENTKMWISWEWKWNKFNKKNFSWLFLNSHLVKNNGK